ncbi:membrane protein insertion efficiency factor YidD [Modestobacter sp. VKM Ac-2978]|uniref:membrane protein insertion efficiency factor YidD n=1 Tax=Modestobacter sp. VKM Ac-2978 TaxID=3004132 RepID=UPI0022AAF515|nr:membrane protein insertion efficiency factor YidD [Modestobacter sp. VKM Ac-2978]MCZ2850992.1 membrane protein insertion efficiency factor YidD [Modestobacter sp. VKM Ac-2978]
MVFIWGWGGGGPRRRRSGWGRPHRGYGPGYGRGYGPPRGYGGYGPGRGYRRNGSCLQNLFFLNTGCCLAQALGCGMDLLLVAPTTVRRLRAESPGGQLADRLIGAVRLYQREVSPRRRPCCHFTPTCSAYAIEALERHGALRGSWLTARRLVRCRPGGARGEDPVPA